MTYLDMQSFKLCLLDVGLLGAMGDLDVKTLIEGSSIFKEFKGSLTEQQVLRQLISDLELRAFYHTTERSTGEVDSGSERLKQRAIANRQAPRTPTEAPHRPETERTTAPGYKTDAARL